MLDGLKKVGVLSGAVLLAACFQEAEPLAGIESFTEFAANNAQTIETVEPNDSCSDLGFLAELTQGINVIGLGEARHDGHEFFQMKRRLIECLVAEQGFNHLVMEDGLPYGEHLNHYLTTGEGDLTALINGMGAWFIWDTDEFAGLMQWLRSYNETRDAMHQVQFHGMDMTDPWPGLHAIAEYFHRIDPAQFDLTDEQLELLEIYQAPIWTAIMQRYSDLDDDQLLALDEIWQEMRQALDTNAARYISLSSSDAFAWVDRQFTTIEQAHEMFLVMGSDFVEGGLIRDAAMADNLNWLVRNAADTDRFIVWSHNLHIAKIEFDLDIPNRPRARLTPTGYYVASNPDLRYLAVGFSFFEGVAPWGLPESASDGLDAALSATDMETFLVDLRNLEPGSAAQRWAVQPRTMRAQGGAATIAPSEAYDALLFIRTLDRSQTSIAAQERFSTLD